MKARHIILAVCLLAVAAGVYLLLQRESATLPQIQAVDYSTALLTKPYQNDIFKFSLSMPGEFDAHELPADDSGATTILVESGERPDGIQIIISPFDEDIRELTADRIRQDVPDLTITEPQPVEIGENYKGLAFKSDNEVFDGASREVWFVFRGNLYQISTYERLDPLLKKIFSTWKFF